MNEELNPTRERKIAAKDAIDEYFAYKTFGEMPNPGGWDDQPVEWIDSITATTHAAKKVENIIEEEMQKEREKKQKEKQKKSRKRR